MPFKAGIPIYLITILWLAGLVAMKDEEVSFDGSSYITYQLSAPIRSRQDCIKLLFRTKTPSGLLLHAGGKNGDFMTLELIRGQLRYSSNLGTVGNISGFHEIYMGSHLADNEWHQIDLTRQGKNILMVLDITRRTDTAKGSYAILELDDKIYIAGIDDVGAKKAKKLHQRKLPFTSFEGCLLDVTLNRQNFALLAKVNDSKTTIHGHTSFVCPRIKYSPVTFTHPQSHIIVSTAPYTDVLSFSFKFRTYESEGLLVEHRVESRQGADIFLWLITSRLKLEVVFPYQFKRVTLHAGSKLDDGMWHSVSASVTGGQARLQVDDEISDHKIRPVHRFSNNLHITIGGARSELVGFVGCMYDIVAQGREVNVSREKSSRILFGNCSLNDHCLPNPCSNGGKCWQRLNESMCDCLHTNYRGTRCEVPAYSGIETCADWKALGHTRDGPYMISPVNTQPFAVHCKMSIVPEPVTIVEHFASTKQVKAANLASRKGGFYFHPVRYEVGLNSIRALIASSAHCRQHLTYNCLNSVIFDSPHEFDLNRGRGARWVSRDGKTMDYWAGATPGSHKCACGITSSCVREDLVCNCDAWDGQWRRDEGYITDASALPVTNIKFSVRGSSTRSNYTLGSLECYGTKKTSTTNPSATIATSTLNSSSSHTEKAAHKTSATSTLPTTTTQSTATLTAQHTTNTPQHSTYGPPIDFYNPPPYIIIEENEKYITIRQNSSQELVLIILSVMLAVFIIVIIILMIRQNLFLPCKCVEGPVYRDVNNVDSIELGPPSSLFTNVDVEVVEYEASPYPPLIMNGGVINTEVSQSCSAVHVNVLESDSNDDIDRLHLGGGTSPISSEGDDKQDWNQNKFESSEYEDLGSLEMVLLKSPQEMVEVHVDKLKEALYDVISASEVNINNNPKIDSSCSFVHDDENYNTTSTISRYGMEFSRPPSYQDIEGACSSEQETGYGTNTRSCQSSASCSWDDSSGSESSLDRLGNHTDSHHQMSLSNSRTQSSHDSDNSSDEHEAQNSCETSLENKSFYCKDDIANHLDEQAESEPLLTVNLSCSPSEINGVMESRETESSDVESDVSESLLAHAQCARTVEIDIDGEDSDLRESYGRHETAL